MLKRLLLPALPLLLFSCTTTQTEHAESAITLDGLVGHIKVLASDDFQGRKPFTEGETKTIKYLEEQFRSLGLEPGNGKSYLQDVPLTEITPRVDSVMEIKGKGKQIALRGFDDFVLNTERSSPSIIWKDEEIVFAGFGIVAPEYNWNDYEGLNVKGKIVLVLVNDPGFGGTDTTFFKGNTMTYYGRWTYKYEEAERQGAKGCLVIHNTVPAGYPFAVLQNTWNTAHLYLDERGKDVHHCEGIGWITKAATERLFAASGFDFSDHQSLARKSGYKGMNLGMKASVSVAVKSRNDMSHNVIAKITGTKRPNEYIIYSSHWDHLGIGKKDANGDSIFNGAYDNASGAAGLLELAKAFSKMEPKPERTVVFLSVTAEEQGLWGAAYYAQNPIFPKGKTVANINMDGINPYGRMKDVMVVGKGQSELEDYLKDAATAVGRDVTADSEPEKGSYFRSDHFWFAKIGVPALYLKPGDNFIGKGTEHGRELKSEYYKEHYHQPSDEYDSARSNYEGGVDDLKLLFMVGKRLAFESTWPKWKSGSEFRAIRESYKRD